MNAYLFSQNLLSTVSILCGISYCTYYVTIYKRYHYKQLLVITGSAALLLLAEISVTSKLFGLSNIPAFGYIYSFIGNSILISLFVPPRHRLPALVIGIFSLVSTLALLALTINNFYQYFPSIGSIFIHNSIRSQNASSITEAHIKQHYMLPSIEQTMFAGNQTEGVVETVAMPGNISHLNARNGYVYIPPAYNDATLKNVRFPVLILLTGVPGDPSSWLQGGLLTSTMNNFASHHNGITPIVVIADQSGSFTNDTECLNSSHGNAETYLTVDVPNYIKTHYRVSANPAEWGIGGFSEGGMCAAMLTLTHQNIFRHFLDMSGDPDPFLDDYSKTLPVLFHGSKKEQKEHNIDWLLQHMQLQPNFTAQFAIGATDSKKLITEMRQSYHTAIKRDIPASFSIIAGKGHSFDTWSEAYGEALPKLSHYLGATSCDNSCSE